jgi:hypothetical protein
MGEDDNEKVHNLLLEGTVITHPSCQKPSYAIGEYNQLSKSCVCQIYTSQQKTFSITLIHSAYQL